MDYIRAFEKSKLGIYSLIKSRESNVVYLEYNLSTSKYYPFITLDIDNKIIHFYYTKTSRRDLLINKFHLDTSQKILK